MQIQIFKTIIANQNGHTLIEVLLVFSIICLLFCSSLPNFSPLLEETEQILALDKIKNAIELAKNEAFKKNITISLCPSHNSTSCSYAENWEVGFIVFENPERKAQVEKGKIIQASEKSKSGKIIFTALGNQLNIQGDGSTSNIGSFVYCPKNKKQLKPKALVVNWAARIYQTDSDAEKTLESICGNTKD